MSQNHVEIAKRVMDAFSRRDLDAFMEPTTLDFEWLPAMGVAVEGGSYRGREGLQRYWAMVGETWDEFRVTVTDVSRHGRACSAAGSARSSGAG